MTLTVTDRGPVAAAQHEHPALLELDRLLNNGRPREASLVGPDGERINLPESLFRVLRQVIHALAEDQAVSVVPVHKQLTTQQAADLLNVSRPYLVQLLEDGKIPYSKTGTHRRVHLDDLMVYMKVRDAERERAMERLVRLSEELGLYDQDDRFGPPRSPDDGTAQQTNPLNLTEQTQAEDAPHP